MDEYTGSGPGPVAGPLLGLAGLVLVAAGVTNGVAAQAPGLSALLAGSTGNLALSAVLVLVGLAVTLAATVDRV
jgi:hypothetical protein